MTLKKIGGVLLFLLILFGIGSCFAGIDRLDKLNIPNKIEDYEQCIEAEYCTLSHNELIHYERLKKEFKRLDNEGYFSGH